MHLLYIKVKFRARESPNFPPSPNRMHAHPRSTLRHPHPEDRDPISLAIAPPRNESSRDRQLRMMGERAAKQVSDDIDDALSRERQQVRRQPKPVKILLLGKSTTLKNFQLMCEPRTFHAERVSWRAIIQLNVIRSFRVILDAIAFAANSPDRPFSAESTASSSRNPRDVPHPSAEVLELHARLLPLLQIEDILVKRLSSPVSDGRMATTSRLSGPRGKEVAVNSAAGWKNAFVGQTTWGHSTDGFGNWNDPEDPGPVLHASSMDMRRLWAHPIVRAILDARDVRLQESSGFFLDELEVVTSPRYLPTDGYIEYNWTIPVSVLNSFSPHLPTTYSVGGPSREFRIFDVGAKWVPYFDDVDAIIFLAPISAFDQVLAEDHHVNRLADSFELWTSIVSNRLLQRATIILFLNKADLLSAKLSSGIRLSEYLPSYGRRPNDMDSASRYLKKQFSAILKQSSPVSRVFYSHLTNVIDTQSTAYVLVGIRDNLIRSNLQQSQLIL
ncbi:guanine nucleotide binding protein, alpha subunit [Roridomyces roridus]|uniref:Guanine nucleotide binding protein, alpha subunit n=1 Tax=Roridomyces roridus TaxID=1738132 RepID=A0AAD7BEQ9_9AGAR|nr:guanine nucleotide binding protein, alpha subunit [Roridomyces roridus]